MNRRSLLRWLLAIVLLALIGSLSLSRVKAEPRLHVLFFYSPTCPYCQRSMPVVRELSKEYSSKGVQFHFLNVLEDHEAYKLFIKTLNFYSIRRAGVPAFFVGNKRIIGWSKDLKSNLRRMIDECLQDKCQLPEELREDLRQLRR